MERNAADETVWALEGLITDVTKCTVKELVAHETERAVMANGAGMTQYATIELTIDTVE